MDYYRTCLTAHPIRPWSWPWASLQGGGLALSGEVRPQPSVSLSCAPCLWGPQTPACLPLWRAAPSSCRMSLPRRGTGHSGTCRNEWVSVCWSTLLSSGYRCAFSGLPWCPIISQLLGPSLSGLVLRNEQVALAPTKSILIAFVISTFPLIISDSLDSFLWIQERLLWSCFGSI